MASAMGDTKITPTRQDLNCIVFRLLGLLLVLSICNDFSIGELVDMKIVDEVSSYGVPHASAAESQPLTLRVAPANFSGPPHFARLVGRCFSEVVNSYKYNLCPFHNLTQHEQGNQWNPYHGVLGVWQEWEIKNNTFVAMTMRDGDNCDNHRRSARITFECGNSSKIVNVSEPKTCSYHLVLRTPLVCHADSLLVYPTLSTELQQRWDLLEGEKMRGDWTEKGYAKRLRGIFEAAGLYLSGSTHKQLQHRAEEVEQEKVRSGIFLTFDQCKESFKELQEKVKRLEEELEIAKNVSAHHGS